MKHRKWLSLLLTAALAVSAAGSFSGCSDNGSPAPQTSAQTSAPAAEPLSAELTAQFGLRQDLKEGVILHAWSWSFQTIKESMADIAAAGYSAVQTSPANAVVVGGDGGMQLMGRGKWYYQYQPTDWTIGNYQMGTEEDFKAMCAEAHRFGIKVIVDVVPNHTAADKSAVSQNLIDAVGGIDKLYHKNAGEGITNYGDRIQCTTRSLSGLPDVNTENPAFQEYFIKYLNQLIADGADGFRYDTAKHIGLPDDPKEEDGYTNNFWEQVTTKIDKAGEIFNYGEVLQGDNERLTDYIKAIGHTTASDYGSNVRSAIKPGRFMADSFSDFSAGGSTDVVTWVESHDNYTDNSSSGLTSDMIVQGWAIIAANGQGTPLFYDRPYGAEPGKQWGTMNRIGAAGSDLYKDPRVVAVNRMRNLLVGEPTEYSNPDKSANVKLLMIARGAKGVVLVNGKTQDLTISVDTKLPDGTYPDRGGVCGEFKVAGGKLSGTVKAGNIAVLYNDGYTDPVAMPKLSVETDTFITTESSLTVPLHVSGADKGSYELDGKTADFTDGEKVTIAVPADGAAALKLTAVNAQGLTASMTFYFTMMKPVQAGEEISFIKPDSWGKDISVYIYDETVKPTVVNADWPGEKMTLKDDGTYTYTVTKEWKSGLVIFSDGSGNQYPAAMEPGQALEAGKEYSPPAAS